jgi:hypothetical protein
MPGICLADISQTVAVANTRISTVLLQRIFSRMAGEVAESIDSESRLENTRTEQRLCQSLPLVNSSWLQISCIPRSWLGSLARSPTNEVSVKRAFSTTTGFDCHHCVSFVFTVTTSTRNHIKNNKRNTISLTVSTARLCSCFARLSIPSARRLHQRPASDVMPCFVPLGAPPWKHPTSDLLQSAFHRSILSCGQTY